MLVFNFCRICSVILYPLHDIASSSGETQRRRVCLTNFIQWIFAWVFMTFQLKVLCQSIEREHFPFLLIYYSLCHQGETFLKLVAQHNLSLVEINLCQLKAAGLCTGASLVPWYLVDRHPLSSALKFMSNMSPSPQAAIWVLPQMCFSSSSPSPRACNQTLSEN